MRVVAGSLKGRRLVAPKTQTTRPTTDRVREAVFSVLTSAAGPELGGGPVLDAFAGSGALGLEALSRGAGPVVLVERDPEALAALKTNVATLGVENRTRVVVGDVFSLARRGIGGGPFALILLDPPYTLDPTIVADMLAALVRTDSVARGCFVVWEHSVRSPVVWPEGYVPRTEKHYGATGVDFGVYEGGVTQQ